MKPSSCSKYIRRCSEGYLELIDIPLQSLKVILLLIGILNCACEDFVKVDPPKTQLIKSTVFKSNSTAIAAVSDIYYDMCLGSSFTGGGIGESVTFLGGLSSDELLLHSNFEPLQQIFTNNILPSNPSILGVWASAYRLIYKANSIVEGLEVSQGVTPELKMQLSAEAKFIRAFCHFYLVNLFGEVPYITTTDYQINTEISKKSIQDVYQLLISDLIEAKLNLSDNYSFSGGQRVRPNRWAAIALLSRVYLFNSDWINAEAEATTIINNTALFGLESLENTFIANSNEAIWQLIPPFGNKYTTEGNNFILVGNPSNVSLQSQYVATFEVNDGRKIKWIGSFAEGANTWFFPYKYKNRTGASSLSEYSMVFRLAEQYLIRAEAKANLGDFPGAQSDINTLRTRAGLGNILAFTKGELVQAVMNERQHELFAEWGHRWFDLKRLFKNDLLEALKPGWASSDVLYPIPESEILINSNLQQNAGY